MKWAFSDESRRKRTYLMAAVVVPTYAVNDVRREARGFLRKNQRRVHMAKERQARRNQFLDLIAGLEVERIAGQISLSGVTDEDAVRAGVRSHRPGGRAVDARLHRPCRT